MEEMLARQRAADYLWSQQGEDGGWHSVTYGALRPGAALTALILRALATVPSVANNAAPRRQAAAAAVNFLRRGIAKRGCLAAPDGTLDYPVYASSLALLTVQPDWPLWTIAEQRLLAEYLLKSQWSVARGLAATDPDRGGWDAAGSTTARDQSTGTNISLARHALQAIARERQAVRPAVGPAAWPEPWQALRRAALEWLARCQNQDGDGGFFFSPVRSASDNKAGWHDDAHQSPRSYHSATYDGILAYQALGLAPTDPPLAAALRWLEQFDQPVAEWETSLRFYRAAAEQALGPLLSVAERSDREDRRVRALLDDQRADGSWQNRAVRMREDDPLLATALALVALQPLP